MAMTVWVENNFHLASFSSYGSVSISVYLVGNLQIARLLLAFQPFCGRSSHVSIFHFPARFPFSFSNER